MRKIYFVLFTMLAATFTLMSCGPSKEQAMDYNDKIINEQKKIIKAENDLIKAIKKSYVTVDMLEMMLDDLSVQIDDSKKVVEGMKDLGKDTEFKDATLAFLNTYKEVVGNEYKAWLMNLRIPDENVTSEVLLEEEELIYNINKKLDKANNAFTDAQKIFADKYQFKLSNY